MYRCPIACDTVIIITTVLITHTSCFLWTKEGGGGGDGVGEGTGPRSLKVCDNVRNHYRTLMAVGELLLPPSPNGFSGSATDPTFQLSKDSAIVQWCS